VGALFVGKSRLGDVAIHTGMRKRELRGLRWADVDFATGTLHIPQDKAGGGRWVALNSDEPVGVLLSSGAFPSQP
jgi:integrase